MEQKILNNSKNITIVTVEEYTYSFFHCLEMRLLVRIKKTHNEKILSLHAICQLLNRFWLKLAYVVDTKRRQGNIFIFN